MERKRLEKLVFRSLVIFTFGVVIVAAVFLYPLIKQYNQERNAELNGGQSQITTPDQSDLDDIEIDTEEQDEPDQSDPEQDPETESNQEVAEENPVDSQPVTYDYTGWIPISIPEYSYSFMLPPATAEYSHLAEDGREYTWAFEDYSPDQPASAMVFGDYIHDMRISFVPQPLSQYGCGTGCADENVIAIQAGDFVGSQEDFIAQMVSQVALINDNFPPESQVEIAALLTIQKWDQEVTLMQIIGGPMQVDEQSYVLAVNGRKYQIATHLYADIESAEQVTQQVLDSISFQ